MVEETGGEQLIATIKNAAGIILAVTENRNWIEVFFDGDLMHTQTVNLPAASLFSIYVEEIPHKATVYEHPRTMIFFHRTRRSARYPRRRARHCRRRRERRDCLRRAVASQKLMKDAR